MWEFLYEYGLFLAKTVTIVLAIVAIIVFIVNSIRHREFLDDRPGIKIKKLNDVYDNLERQLKSHLMENNEWKQFLKKEKKEEKAKQKASKKNKAEPEKHRKRLFVLDFEGDLSAEGVESLRREITAVLTVADENDGVLVRLESPGGSMFGYGLGASQLQRVRDKKVHLTVSVDKMAASGGYMMACVADKLVAAPFAMIGSVGVAQEIPNINRLLKRLDIDYEQITAGEYKRTLTVFGENTMKAREKVTQELQEAHDLFKSHIAGYRPDVDIDKIATGETWFGMQAKAMNLVDELGTSDDLLMNIRNEADILKIEYRPPMPWQERLAMPFNRFIREGVNTLWKRVMELRRQ